MTTASKVIDTEGLENEGFEEESGFLYDQRKRHSRLTFFLLLDAPDKILLQFRDRHQLFQIPLPQCPLMICLKAYRAHRPRAKSSSTSNSSMSLSFHENLFCRKFTECCAKITVNPRELLEVGAFCRNV